MPTDITPREAIIKLNRIRTDKGERPHIMKRSARSMKKFKCKACGFKFRLEKENRYLSKKSTSLLGSISEKPTIFETFDCPNCGCQNAVGIYEKPIEGEVK